VIIIFWIVNSSVSIKIGLWFFRREPHSLLKPSKSAPTDSETVEKVKPTATRNLILIRHGQYNLAGVKDDERYLTALGICCHCFKAPAIELKVSSVHRNRASQFYWKTFKRTEFPLFLIGAIFNVQSKRNCPSHIGSFTWSSCQHLWPTAGRSSIPSWTTSGALETWIPCNYLIITIQLLT